MLYMISGGGKRLPDGNLPRLLLAWVSTEAVRTQSRTLILGRSLSEFMRKVGVYGSGGANRRRLRLQMDRLFSCQVELTEERQGLTRFIASRVADRGEFWWDVKRPDEPVLWDSKIHFGEALFHEIIRRPVPPN